MKTLVAGRIVAPWQVYKLLRCLLLTRLCLGLVMDTEALIIVIVNGSSNN